MKKILFLIFILIILSSIFAIPVQAETYTNYVVVIDEYGHTHFVYPSINTLNPSVMIYHPDETTTVVYPTYPITIITEEKNDTTNTVEPIEENITEEPPQEITNDLAKEIFNLINKERVTANLTELNYNYDLQEAANLRAEESATLFAHTRPNGDVCYSVFNVDYAVAGENLIQADKEIADAKNLVKTWMESEGHRANILLPEFTSVAIGVYIKDNMVYASQLFVG